MVVLLPRLPGPAAESLIDRFLADGPNDWTGFDPDDLPQAVRFAATGGSRAGRRDLVRLREAVLGTARANGFGTDNNGDSHAGFDAELGALLGEMPLLSSGEALRDDLWTFVGVSLAPDVVHWRFGTSRERYLGGVRNTFQRMWLRARALDRGEQHPKRWQLLEELTEDALVQITERPSIGADPVLAGAVAETWLRAGIHHGKSAMEPIMRRAVLRVRIWNEIRSLADLPAKALARVLDDAFDLPDDGQHDSEGGDQRWQTEGLPSSNGADSTRRRAGAARRILEEATRRRWISPKSMAGLVALRQEPWHLDRSERNALAYLLERMRAVAELHEEVALLARVISAPDSRR